MRALTCSCACLAALIGATLSACSDAQGPGGPVRHIEAVNTAPLTGTPLDTASAALAVRVTDDGDRPAVGESVAWSSTDGGTFAPSSALTDSDGVARAKWILGPAVGIQHASVTVEGSPLNHTQFEATADAFRAKSLSLGEGAGLQCAIDAAGKVWCWESNAAPTAVSLGQPAIQVATTGDPATTACALTAAGTVYCWGANGFGQFGNGASGTSSATPVAVNLPPLQFKQITMFGFGACAVSVAGDGYCWGRNQDGRFGNGTGTGVQAPIVLMPTLVGGGIAWQHLALGDDRACGVKTDRTVYCWGRNVGGNLGIGVDTDTALPLAVVPAPLMDSVTLNGYHQCGITVDHRTYCWGMNYNIGFDPAPAMVASPTALPASPAFQSVHSAFKPTFALGVDGRGYWWGPAPNATGGPVVPTPLPGGISLQALGTSEFEACGIEAGSGVVFCWSGFNIEPAIPPKVRAIPVPSGG